MSHKWDVRFIKKNKIKWQEKKEKQKHFKQLGKIIDIHSIILETINSLSHLSHIHLRQTDCPSE